ncbi:MAG: AAA domain-containing protein [Kiritimatiellia bacterium]
MSVEIWIGEEYENTGESEMVSQVVRKLVEALGPLRDEFHILCNFSVPGYTKQYRSSVDMAVLRGRALVILELKNYGGKIVQGVGGKWYCGSEKGEEVKGGSRGRTPLGQVADYRRQTAALMKEHQSVFLSEAGAVGTFDFKKFVSAAIVFSNQASADWDALREGCLWLKVVPVSKVAETVCQFAGGRGTCLTDGGMRVLVEQVLGLRRAYMVDSTPMVPGAQNVTAEKPVDCAQEGTAPMAAEALEEVLAPEYEAVARVWESSETPREKVARLHGLFHQLLWDHFRRRYSPSSGATAREFLAGLFSGDRDLLAWVNRFRLLGNRLAREPELEVSEEDWRESFKTCCLTVRHLTGTPLPKRLADEVDRIVHRACVSYGAIGSQVLYAEVCTVAPDRKVLFCESDTGKPVEVVWSGAGEGEQTAIPDCIHAGVSVSLILDTPAKDAAGRLRAKHIVLEPDFLISPQSIGYAQEFGNSALYFWLNAILPERLLKDDHSSAQQFLLRGDFANTALADACAGSGDNPKTRLSTFFAQNPISLTVAAPEGKWFNECIQQDGNIQRFITKTIPETYGVQSNQWHLEAPLYSPIYGLAAQVDALACDPKTKTATILELKSGKWDTYQGNKPKRAHAVQPILYASLLEHAQGIPPQAVNQALCYAQGIENRWTCEPHGILFGKKAIDNVWETSSRTAESLLVEHRNDIISLIESIRTGTFRSLVGKATIEGFRREVSGDERRKELYKAYWKKHHWKYIEKLLNAFHGADALTRLYLYRWLQFLVAEMVYSSRGGLHRAGGATWLRPPQERARAGLRLANLRIKGTPEKDRLGRLLSFAFDTTRSPLNKHCSIREGDSVFLFRSSGKPDESIAHSRLFAATVARLTAESIALQLDNPQAESLFEIAPDAEYAVEPRPATFHTSSLQGLGQLLIGNERRRRLVLNQEMPTTDPDRCLPMGDEVVKERYPLLHTLLLRAWQARDWFLIWGPPGTGKTSRAMRALVDLSMATPGMRILLLAYTYRATDEICRMLEQRIAGDSIAPPAPEDIYLRLGTPLKCHPEPHHPPRFAHEMGFANRGQFQDYADRVRIVVAPVAALAPDHPVCAYYGHFDLAIVDEASQLLDAHILPLFCANRLPAPGEKPAAANEPLIGKFIFVGDDRQLPAVVQQSPEESRIREPRLTKLGFVDCRESFFERLRRLSHERPDRFAALKTQYRMHPAIAAFCNACFYDGKLANGKLLHQTAGIPLPPSSEDPFAYYTLTTRFGFYPILDETAMPLEKVSSLEAECCARIIRLLTSNPCRAPLQEGEAPHSYAPGDIGVIVPFRNQIAAVRDAIAHCLDAEKADGILVDTVERFQGSERSVILFSTVIQSLSEASLLSETSASDDENPFDRRLNVAVTRARERFYLVGNDAVLRNLPCYGQILDWIARQSGPFVPEIPF